MNAVLVRSNLKLGFWSKIWEDFGASIMLSGECSYTFGSVVKAEGRVRCLEKLWKLEVLCEVSVEWNRYFKWIPLKMDLESYWSTDWLVARLSCVSPTGMGFDFCFWKDYFWNGMGELGSLCAKSGWCCKNRKIRGLGFELFLRGKCWPNGQKFGLFRKDPLGYFNSSLEVSKKLALCCHVRNK